MTSPGLASMLHHRQGPALLRSPGRRPEFPSGLSSGDLLGDRAILWSRSDRPAKMWVEWSAHEKMKDATRLEGPNALPVNDFTAKLDLQGLPADTDIFYQIRFQSLEDLKVESRPLSGRFRTPPQGRRDVSFLWSGDMCGQGWGINPEWGGIRIFEAMRQTQADFFIHSGDTIYADGVIHSEEKLRDGSTWKNLTTEAKSKVAETLDEFRGNYAYNLMDQHVRNFLAEIPVLYQWDDHETTNNWYPQEILDDDRYTEKRVSMLSARAKRAFFEYNPIRSPLHHPERIYRRIPYGPSLEVFMLDMRSYRSANNENDQPLASKHTRLLGEDQLQWLKDSLKNTQATWKVIAADMPVGLIVPDYTHKRLVFENMANTDGPPRGRELEMAELLRFIKDHQIQNIIWLTADVHYTAAHYYDPHQAQFQDFLPFYEFVSGPLHAGTFGPNLLDNTFGPQILFQQVPPADQRNLPPSAGMQFFGQVRISGESERVQVDLRDLYGKSLYQISLDPVK